jgi:hypothetical protein
LKGETYDDSENAPNELISEAFKFTIIKVTPFDLDVVRLIDVKKNIEKFLNSTLSPE